MTSRRQFLATLTGGLAAAASTSAGETKLRRRSVGYGLYGMKSLPVDVALGRCAEIGYRNVELALYPGYGVSPEDLSAVRRADLRRRLESLHLDLSGMKVRLLPEADSAAAAANIQTLAAAAALARDLSPHRPPALVAMTEGKSADWDVLKESLVRPLQRWAGVLDPFGVTLVLKAHVGYAVNTPEKLMWLLHRVDRSGVRAAYDYSHYELAERTLEESLRQVAPLMSFIHVKDVHRTPSGHRFTLPGEGQTDYPRYAALLDELGYTGPVVVEVSTHVFSQPGYEPIAAARRAFRAVSAFA